jgi:F-type H+-transporting ATPase subunit b
MQSAIAHSSAIAHLFASSSAVSVDFDLTFVAQLVLFATFLVVMKPMLFDPLLRVFEERERRTEGAKDDARDMDARAGELAKQYEAELEKVRQAAAAERETARAKTAKVEAQMMAEARAEVAAIVEQGKARIDAEVAGLRKDLDQAQPGLAAEIASRMLGREVRQ